MFIKVIKTLSEEQEEWINETGFNFALMFTLKEYAEDICMFIMNSLQPSLFFEHINKYLINFGEDDVHRVLRLPKGDIEILFTEDHECLFLWEAQFNKDSLCNDIMVSTLCDIVKESVGVDECFKKKFHCLVSKFLY